MTTLSPLDVAIGRTEVYGKYQFLRRFIIRLPLWHNHARERTHFSLHSHLHIVETSLHIIVSCAEGGLGAFLARYRHIAALMSEELEAGIAVAQVREQLHLVGIGSRGAHKGEDGSAQLNTAHDTARSHLLVELPVGVGHGEIGAREFHETLAHGDAQGHRHAAIGVLNNAMHGLSLNRTLQVSCREIVEEKRF